GIREGVADPDIGAVYGNTRPSSGGENHFIILPNRRISLAVVVRQNDSDVSTRRDAVSWTRATTTYTAARTIRNGLSSKEPSPKLHLLQSRPRTRPVACRWSTQSSLLGCFVLQILHTPCWLSSIRP